MTETGPRAGTTTDLSVVIPVYRAAECLEELDGRLTAVLSPLTSNYEVIYVEDGSPDESWNVLQSIAARNPRAVIAQLSRNFGQHPALAAGLSLARGARIVVMDCDLQDPPEEVPRLLAAATPQIDVVLAKRANRAVSRTRWRVSRAAQRMLGLITEAEAGAEVGTFSVITSQVAAAYLQLADTHAHYLQVLRWLGFRRAFVDVPRSPRFRGRSSYSLRRLIHHFWDGVASNSRGLLHVSIYIGFAFCLLSILQIAYIVFRKVYHGIAAEGWASLMAVTWLVGGATLFSLGVVGIYIGRIFEQGQRRPTFVIRQVTRSNDGAGGD